MARIRIIRIVLSLAWGPFLFYVVAGKFSQYVWGKKKNIIRVQVIRSARQDNGKCVPSNNEIYIKNIYTYINRERESSPNASAWKKRWRTYTRACHTKKNQRIWSDMHLSYLANRHRVAILATSASENKMKKKKKKLSVSGLVCAATLF